MTFICFLNQIKFTIPRCVDCKHYLITEPHTMYASASAKCTRVIYQCSDTSVNKYEYAYITRSEQGTCGPKGLHFLQKEDLKK